MQSNTKKLSSLITLSLLTLSPLTLFADVEEGDWALQKVVPPANKGPFSVSANYDATGGAKFDDEPYDDDKLKYAQGNVTGAVVVYYNPTYDEGALVSLGYTNVHLDWDHNPFFDQKTFQTINVTIGGFTKRLRDWDLKALLTANIDIRPWNCNYINYDLTLWGKYSYCQDISLHFGIIAQTGMKMDRVYPILGFDWKITPDWTLDFVFPIDMGLYYNVTKEWSVGVAARFFDYRNRLKDHELLSKGVFRYQSTGAELAVNYDNDDNITADLHGGMILGGHLRIANQHNNHPHRLKFKTAPYAGGAVSIRF